MRAIPRRFFLSLPVATLLAGCTAVYQRQFQVVPERELSSTEIADLVQRYRDFMVKHGLTAEQVDATSGADVVFVIRDKKSILLPTSRITDRVVVRILPTGVVVGLHRISSYPPDDFSPAYLATFTRLTSDYFRESSGMRVRLEEVQVR
jgi:hypothetical protein